MLCRNCYKIVPDDIKFCPECGNPLGIEAEIKDESRTIPKKTVGATNSRQSAGLKKILTTIALVIIVLSCSGGFLAQKLFSWYAVLPVSADSVIGEDADQVISALKDAGFKNILLERNGDIEAELDAKDGIVESVYIDDNDSFAAGDKYSKNATIRIIYRADVANDRIHISEQSVELDRMSNSDNAGNVDASQGYSESEDSLTETYSVEEERTKIDFVPDRVSEQQPLYDPISGRDYQTSPINVFKFQLPTDAAIDYLEGDSLYRYNNKYPSRFCNVSWDRISDKGIHFECGGIEDLYDSEDTLIEEYRSEIIQAINIGDSNSFYETIEYMGMVMHHFYHEYIMTDYVKGEEGQNHPESRIHYEDSLVIVKDGYYFQSGVYTELLENNEAKKEIWRFYNSIRYTGEFAQDYDQLVYYDDDYSVSNEIYSGCGTLIIGNNNKNVNENSTGNSDSGEKNTVITNTESVSSSSKKSSISESNKNTADDGNNISRSNDSRTVYITESGDKYHENGCRMLRNSKIPIALSDAEANGYEACQICH